MWDKPDVKYSTEFIHLLPEWIRNLDPFIFLSSNFLVLDFETTTVDFGNPHLEENDLVLAGWWYQGIYKEFYGNEFEQDALVEDIHRADFIVAHNAKFELGWLRRIGVDVTSLPVWCTQVGEYVLRGNRSHIGLSLDATGKRRNLPINKIKVIEKLWKLGVSTHDIPRTLLSRYCQRDVLLALAVFREQLQDIISNGLLTVMYVRCWLPVVLMDIESRGMQLDYERVKIISERTNRDYQELFKQIVVFTGGVDVDSHTQLREYLYETLRMPPPKKYDRPWLTPKAEERRDTPSPENYSTDAKALAVLKPRTKKQKEFLKLYLEYKSVSGDLTKYLDKFIECCENDDGILTANINQTVTKTHRTSSSGRNYACQFQNFKRVFKPLFKCRRPGWRFVERDQSQLEFRTGVQLCNDGVGYKELKEHTDHHAVTARMLFDGFDEMEGDERKRTRTKAKADTFKPLFGGTSGTRLQKEYYDYFKTRYEGITSQQQLWINECLSNKKFRNPPNGLIFYFPHVKVNPKTGYVHENEKIRNIPIQSTATADVVLIGLVAFWHLVRSSNLNSFIVNTVHDSIETEEHPDEREKMDELGRWAMLDATYWVFDKLYNYPWQVELDIETEANDHWSNTLEWEKEWLG
jgi:DNA polymerase-1